MHELCRYNWCVFPDGSKPGRCDAFQFLHSLGQKRNSSHCFHGGLRVRSGELRRGIDGVQQKMPPQALQCLRGTARDPCASVPPTVEYSPDGKDYEKSNRTNRPQWLAIKQYFAYAEIHACMDRYPHIPYERRWLTGGISFQSGRRLSHTLPGSGSGVHHSGTP